MVLLCRQSEIDKRLVDMVSKDQRFGDVVAKALARRSRNDGHEIEHANRSLPPKDAACAPRYGARNRFPISMRHVTAWWVTTDGEENSWEKIRGEDEIVPETSWRFDALSDVSAGQVLAGTTKQRHECLKAWNWQVSYASARHHDGVAGNLHARDIARHSS